MGQNQESELIYLLNKKNTRYVGRERFFLNEL